MDLAAEPFRDPSRSVAERVADLLARMTLREKVGQLNQRLLGWHTYERTTSGFVTTPALDEEAVRWHGIGAIYGLQRADAWSGRSWENGLDAAAGAEVAALVQERVRAASRFGIPALLVEEAPHGHQALGASLLPTNLAVAASWRPDLLEAAAVHAARELTARGTHLALVSGLDLLRDPRWGRAEETLGEDALLASRFVRALVRGMRAGGAVAVIKHFAAQGAGIGGRNSSGAPIGPRELREVHLPAARAGVDEGALGVMAAYNDIDGIPCLANRELLTDTLRGAWGFDGIVMADMGAIDRLIPAAGSLEAAAAIALNAGCDLSMRDEAYTAIERAVELQLVDEATVEVAASRVLTLKIGLGLLDAAAPLPSFPPPHSARALVDATTVLLQNRGDLLPLATRPARVAVIGPNAESVDCLLGDYVPPLPDGYGVSLASGIRSRTEDVVVEPGSGLTDPIDGGIARAVDAASSADLVVLALGGTSERGYDDDFQANGAASLGGMRPAATSGEGFDVAEVTLPEAQLALVAAVAATRTPIVAVVIAGRPHAIGAVLEHADAVLFAGYPGPEGGDAIADLVLGDREPVGRLPVSIPRSSGVLPATYDERIEGTKRYVDEDAAPLFPFGAGLGYTRWALGAATVSGDWPECMLTVPLTNTGARRGAQVVQLYGRALVPGIASRRAVLLGSTHVTADAGSTTAVTVPVDPDALAHLGDPVAGRVLLWASVTGAGEPDGAVEVPIR